VGVHSFSVRGGKAGFKRRGSNVRMVGPGRLICKILHLDEGLILT
jgi:hypothetical protein